MAQLDTLIGNENTAVFGLGAFEQIVLNAPVAISITDSTGQILFVNQMFSDITEYSGEEIIGCHSSILSYKATPRNVYQTLWETISSGQHWQGQLVNKKKSGTPYIADISISRFTNNEGEHCYYAIQKDITEQHKVQTHQENQFTMFQAVLNAAPIAIALADEHNNVLFNNDRFAKLQQSINEAPVDLLLKNIQMESKFRSIHEFMGNKLQKYKGIHIDNHGPVRERWLDYILVKIPVSDTTAETYFKPNDGFYTVIAITDRTREKMLVEERRINAMKLLTRDNKYVHAMQEALMATLHQLQGPFNMIESAVNILKQTNNSCPGLIAMDEAMGNAVSAMDEIKQAIPERNGEAFQPVNLNQIIRDVTSITTDDLLFSSTKLDLLLSNRLSVINGMPHRLVLALKQLIDNAIDSIQSSKASERIITISSIERDSEINIIVEDSGIGIDEAIRLKIFQPFYSSKPKHQSGCRGIGLSIVQQVLNEHSATIAIEESERLGGAKICLTFPNSNW
ncbi:nitrogen fixation negative regulator NifL [Vibrio sp. RC27]